MLAGFGLLLYGITLHHTVLYTYKYKCKYIYIYIWMVPPPCTHACVLNLGFWKGWVLGMPLFPSLSPKSQLQTGVG